MTISQWSGYKMRYLVYNRTISNIQIIIPEPVGSGRSSACLTLPPSGAIDILPYCGTIEECRRLGCVRDLAARGIVGIQES